MGAKTTQYADILFISNSPGQLIYVELNTRADVYLQVVLQNRFLRSPGAVVGLTLYELNEVHVLGFNNS